MKNGCGKSFQNDVISVILSQKGENPSLSPLRMRGMAGSSGSARSNSQRREKLPRVNLANPKVGKHQYFHVPAHVARRHCLAGSIDEPERRR